MADATEAAIYDQGPKLDSNFRGLHGARSGVLHIAAFEPPKPGLGTLRAGHLLEARIEGKARGQVSLPCGARADEDVHRVQLLTCLMTTDEQDNCSEHHTA